MFYLLSVREKVTFGGIMAEATDTFTNLGFDPDALRNKYREEGINVSGKTAMTNILK